MTTASTTRHAEASVAVDLVIFTVRGGALQVLLIERGKDPFRGMPALPGGYVRENETLDQAAVRELAEETGVASPRLQLEQLRAYGDPARDPRGHVISIAYLALCPGLPEPVAGIGPGDGLRQARAQGEVGDGDDVAARVARRITVGAQLLQLQPGTGNAGLLGQLPDSRLVEGLVLADVAARQCGHAPEGVLAALDQQHLKCPAADGEDHQVDCDGGFRVPGGAGGSHVRNLTSGHLDLN